jgi:hypothetical protein
MSTQASQLAQTLAAPPTIGFSHADLVDAKKICKCPPAGTRFTNYGSYLRAKRAKIVGCCCTGTVANLYNIYGPC